MTVRGACRVAETTAHGAGARLPQRIETSLPRGRAIPVSCSLSHFASARPRHACRSTLVRRQYSTGASSDVTLCRVPNQALLSVKGRDAHKLLQGLVTNDIRRLEASSTQQALAGDGSDKSDHALYCAFLNPQGRMLATAFLHPIDADHVLVDTDARTAELLLAFIKRFKVRSKVQLSDVSNDHAVWSLFGSGADSAMEKLREGAEATDASQLVVAKRDGRTPAMGYRLLTRADTRLSLGGSLLQSKSGADAATETQGIEYTVHRMLQGIPEGPDEIVPNQSLPLEASLDYAGGVDFRKGCYVGQELTARTHHTGVVRKRVVPVNLYRLDSTPPTAAAFEVEHQQQQVALPESGADVRSVPIPATTTSDQPARPARGKSAGKFLSGIGNIGLGLLRLEQVARWTEPGSEMGSSAENGLMIRVKVGEEEVGLRPWIPSWWPKAESEGRGKPAIGSDSEGDGQ